MTDSLDNAMNKISELENEKKIKEDKINNLTEKQKEVAGKWQNIFKKY